MNAPIQPRRLGMQHAVDETNRRAGPSPADRERITGALRARLGASVVPDVFAPAPGAALSAGGVANNVRAGGDLANAAIQPSPRAARSGLGRGGWLGVVAGTSIVTSVLGFVLGYRMAQRDELAQRERVTYREAPALVGARSGLPAAAATARPPSATERPAVTRRPEPAGEPHEASGPHEADVADDEKAPAPSESRPRTPALGTARPAPRATRAESAIPDGAAAPRGVSFAEVLQRLQRANRALRQGQAPLALIQLAELDRTGGDILREEREVTRVLALCTIGDEPGARRAAATLLTGAASSIYAPRLASSCARSREP